MEERSGRGLMRLRGAFWSHTVRKGEEGERGGDGGGEDGQGEIDTVQVAWGEYSLTFSFVYRYILVKPLPLCRVGTKRYMLRSVLQLQVLHEICLHSPRLAPQCHTSLYSVFTVTSAA